MADNEAIDAPLRDAAARSRTAAQTPMFNCTMRERSCRAQKKEQALRAGALLQQHMQEQPMAATARAASETAYGRL